MTLPQNKPFIDFLCNLFDTNKEFAENHGENFFAEFSNQQNPKLTLVTCCDSRVQIESFDKTPQNEVFAVRNIGNQIVNSEGCVDFGIELLKTPFLLILGHSNCGAINAVIEQQQGLPLSIRKELTNLKINNIGSEAVVENVNNQVKYAVQKYADKIKEQTLTVVGGIYDFKNDYGSGHGKIILVNINNITDSRLLKKHYADLVSNLILL